MSRNIARSAKLYNEKYVSRNNRARNVIGGGESEQRAGESWRKRATGNGGVTRDTERDQYGGSLGNEPPAISVRVDRVPPRCSRLADLLADSSFPSRIRSYRHSRERYIPHNKYRQLCNTARGITRAEAPAKMVLATTKKTKSTRILRSRIPGKFN